MTADWLPKKIVSGGQTGVDRAALDWAIAHGIEHGGWCPRGRRAFDGPLDARYRLQETASSGYRKRTRMNVHDSDATLIFNRGELGGGTELTARFAQGMDKPYRVFQLDESELHAVARDVVAWLAAGRFHTLNVAGPAEQKRPGIHDAVLRILDACLEAGA